MKFLDEKMRDAGVGVWQYFPHPKSFERKEYNAGLRRLAALDLWRTSTRHEIMQQYYACMKNVYKHTALSIMTGLLALVFLYYFVTTAYPIVGLGVVLFGVLCMHYWTRVWGGLAGEWADYEADPVRMVTHNAYVRNRATGMI